MAFDQSTRNRLQKLVSDCRKLLSEEFGIQLQQTYGIDPNSGEVAGLDRLTHLSDRDRQTAQLLRDTLAHYLAVDADDKAHRIAAIDRIIREQAFTVLNRLAALLMMEARGLLAAAVVSQGQQSQAFELYKYAAGSSLGETGDAYRTFLFSLFDEFAIDLPALFDRYAAQGRLFPREPALLEVLDALNHHEVQPLWAEDETIGWIYQYFNSKEERKAMRDASQAPRNSRELAVRNQFFTPRYVVEFLVDNTLGRMWFNATGGQTALREHCQYLLVKPDEQPQVSARLRDPRTLKLLDPACGSMHFGLYAFDLFLQLYQEAWDWEQAHGPGSLDVSTQPNAGLLPLCQTYADREAYQRDVPRLIVEHNIYGVDIDPRAAQIASLALWLRAQRAWHDAGVKAQQRPDVGRGHVVASVAPPAERELRLQFSASLDKRDAELFEKTLQLLKGLPELGVLLQVERELPSLIRQVYVGAGSGLFAAEEQESWEQAEARLRSALVDFAQAAKSTYQGRLFAQDALEGLRIIDLTRETFDVVVMNPPFGEAAERARGYQKDSYPNSHQDIYQCFVERAVQLTRSNGFVGVLSARTGFFMGDSESWRTEVVWRNQLTIFADLGLGVLDDALVEAAAYVIQHDTDCNDQIIASRHLATRDKEASLLASIQALSMPEEQRRDVYLISQSIIESIPGGVFGYWAPVAFLERFREGESFHRQVGAVRQGLATADDFRFARLSWEVLPESIGPDRRWSRFSKGGEYSPPYDDIHLLVDWADNGRQLRAFSRAFIRNESFYHRPGATYTVRTASAFAAKILPAGCVFSHNAQSWFVDDTALLVKSIVYFLCRVPQTYMEIAVGGGDIATSGSAARRYTTKVVHSIPASVAAGLAYEGYDEDCQSLFRLVAFDQSVEETTCFFSGYPLSECKNIDELARRLVAGRQSLVTKALRASWRLDKAVTAAWGLTSSEIEFVRSEVGSHPCEYEVDAPKEKVGELLALPVDELIRRAVEQDGASRWLTKKSYFVDRKTELICHTLRCSPESVEATVASLLADHRNLAERLLSYAVGAAFGRWTKGRVDNALVEKFVHSPFDELPAVQPAAERGSSGSPILVNDPGHEHSIVGAVEYVLRSIWPENSEKIEGEIVAALGSDLDRYFERDFFANHIATYSKSRRTAPMYWPLSSVNGNYTVWIYYHKLTSQTLFTVVNDFIEPKLKDIRDELDALRSKGPNRSRQEEKSFDYLANLENELADLCDSLLEIAPYYRPNHHDGVEITAAPLWRLFRHKPWQKVLKDTWAKLEKGDYDWAHLAMNYWPDRVRDKCVTDKSLAIAHGLEHLYVEPEPVEKKTRGRKKAGSTE